MRDKLRSFTPAAISRGASEAGSVPAILSTGGIARDGFRIDQAGWELDNFRQNPVTLFNHDDGSGPARTLPIGLWRDLDVNSDMQLTGVSDLDMDDDFARQVAGKIERGLINATSVRWIPLEHRIEKRSRAETEADGGPESVLVFTRSELLEASIVVLPADPRAVILRADGAHEFSADEFTRTPKAPEPKLDPLSLCDVVDTARALIEARAGGVFTPAEQDASSRLYAEIARRIPGMTLPASGEDDVAEALNELIPAIRGLIESQERQRAQSAQAADRILKRAIASVTGR